MFAMQYGTVQAAKFVRMMSTVANTVHPRIAGRKRFYKHVDVKNLENDMFTITLDGRTLKTPARNPLHVPKEDIAIAIAMEWDAQCDVKTGIQPVTMPYMTLASTAIDQVTQDRSTAISTCLKYLATDTALFYTTEDDRILLRKQRTHFAPLTRWLKDTLDIQLNTTNAMTIKIAHPTLAIRRVEAIVNSLDPFVLTCLQSVTMECKSLVMALATIGRYITLDQLKVASRLEEEFQVEIWGVVEGGHDMDRLNNQVNLATASAFMNMYWDSTALKDNMNAWKELCSNIKE